MQIMLPFCGRISRYTKPTRTRASLPLNCPISTFGGLQDRKVSHGDLEAWRDQTSVSFSLRMFPGDHFFLNTTQPLLLQVLSQELRDDW